MPEQKSNRGLTITASPFEQPFETPEIPLGVKGLNLHDDIEALEPGVYTRFTNGYHDASFALTSRPGLTTLVTGGTNHHSVRRFNNPGPFTWTRIWGVDTSIALAQTGALTALDSGYSGDPLCFLPHRPPLSGEAWMFVADRLKMRKVRFDGLVLPLGLPAPDPPVVSLANEFSRVIAMCDDSDGTPPEAWTPAPGKDANDHPTDTPLAATVVAGPIAGTGAYFVTAPGATVDSAYDSWWGVAVDRDLTTLTEVGGSGTVPASDNDIVHCWMLTSHPHIVAEIRLYVVISETFDPLVLPGTPTSDTPDATPGANQDAYVKAFRPNDYVQFVQARTAQVEAAEQARIYALRDKDSKTRGYQDARTSWQELRAQADPARARSFQLGLGENQWFGYGQVGSAFRRGDFQRIGSTAGRDWSTVTGLIIYVRTLPKSAIGPIAIGLDDWYITGGFGPDTVEPGAEMYDYRVTNYDPRTGAESNGSEELPVEEYVDSVRRHIQVEPPAAGDAALRQRIYRRGGSLIDDWYYVGVNDGDGATLIDEFADDAISAAGTLPIDHFEAVPTVDAAGNTVLAQPLPVLFGPYEGLLFGLGDPYRPGHVYWCLPDAPDHWSASDNHEVCAPSEELLNGCLFGGQPYVFSRERLYVLYPNLTGQGGLHSLPSGCTRGLASRWLMCLGPGGIFFGAMDGIFVTSGGPEQKVSADIEPLFLGKAVNGYQPINRGADAEAFRLVCFANELYFQYEDTSGERQILVCDLESKAWRHYKFAIENSSLAVDEGTSDRRLIIGGRTSGKSYDHDGFSDDSTAIAVTARTGAWHYGRPREDKLFGDQILDVDRQGVTISVQNFLNGETVANPIATLSEGTGRTRAILDGFGTVPQKARSLATELTWSSDSARPSLYRLGASVISQPDLTINRVTQWQDGGADEVYLTGVTFDCDTGGETRLIMVEYDFHGIIQAVPILEVTTAGRHKVKFSWPAVQANLFRVRPTEACKAWLLYRADWILQEEPPRIARWDISFENKWDQYYTGLDLYCDTGGATKTIEVLVDEVLVVNPATGGTTFPVTTNGRKVVHLTLTWGRGHVFRFRATDDNPGLLYNHRWFLVEEPSEQANWNQPFTDAGTLADKWFKAFAFEIDTFGQTKSVDIEIDGVVVETLPVTTNGRRVVQLAMTQQHLGRILRVFPSDQYPSRPYRIDPIFDVEPYQLNRWETQETTHGIKGYKTAIDAHITLVSTAAVTLTITIQRSQSGAGALQTLTYTLPSTNGVKLTRHQHFDANKGVLFKYLVTSTAPFYLYREESTLTIQPWGAAAPQIEHPFGNDDLDPTRGMTAATLAAARSGGTAD